MTVGRFFVKTGRGLAIATAILVAIGLTTAPRPADAGGWGGGGISPGAAVGLGLGAFALGSVLSRPYYNPYYYPYGYYGYPPAPAYYPRRRIIRIIRRRRPLTRRVPAIHLNRPTRLRQAGQAVTSLGN